MKGNFLLLFLIQVNETMRDHFKFVSIAQSAPGMEEKIVSFISFKGDVLIDEESFHSFLIDGKLFCVYCVWMGRDICCIIDDNSLIRRLNEMGKIMNSL